MVLAASSVVFITTEEFAEAQSRGLTNTYTVRQSDQDASNGERLSDSLLNGIIIVSVICAMTFVIVLLYKYRCMKFLLGYMILSSMMLLGFLASIMFSVAIDRYEIRIDAVSFYLFLWNFAIVGTTSIFYGKGIPAYVTQAYLIITSVIVAWQLSFFDAWTAWVLLVLLALYDLFAVLTPCGPLKALVKLMSRENSPDMPGLLYEARLPETARRRQRNQEAEETAEEGDTEEAGETEEEGETEEDGERAEGQGATTEVGERTEGQGDTTEVGERTDGEIIAPPSDSAPTVNIPLALAKAYKLPLRDDPTPPWRQDNSNVSYTPEQLCSLVDAVLPINGGRIEIQEDRQRPGRETRYTVLDRQGQVQRVLFVNAEGRVFEDMGNPETEQADAPDNSIKLGLGDFIFYSILVAKAAIYSFTTFAVCTLAILAGLGLTLLLLSVYGQALPALPISIFLGVSFYLITRYVIEPWVHAVFEEQLYV